jgi:hypothetical protein
MEILNNYNINYIEIAHVFSPCPSEMKFCSTLPYFTCSSQRAYSALGNAFRIIEPQHGKAERNLKEFSLSGLRTFGGVWHAGEIHEFIC